MKRNMTSIATGLLAIALATQGLAAPPEGKGGGKDKTTNSGGDGSRTPNPVTMSIAFRDRLSETGPSDGIRSAEFADQFSVYEGYDPDTDILNAAGDRCEIIRNPKEATDSVDLVVTDVWASMGQEEEQQKRAQAFADYCVDDDLVACANTDASPRCHFSMSRRTSFS